MKNYTQAYLNIINKYFYFIKSKRFNYQFFYIYFLFLQKINYLFYIFIIILNILLIFITRDNCYIILNNNNKNILRKDRKGIPTKKKYLLKNQSIMLI